MPLDAPATTSPILRDYQVDGEDKLLRRIAAGKRRPLLCGPTGSGKAVMIGNLALRAARAGHQALIAVHTDELVLHHHDLLTRYGAGAGVISAAFPDLADPDAALQIASVYTLANRLHLLNQVTVLLIDEAHHAVAQTWRTILSAAPENGVTIGFTATPLRLDGQPLDDIFDDLILLPQPQLLIDQGWLAPPKVFAPPERLDLSQVKSAFGDYAHGQLEAAVGRANIFGDAVREYRRHAHGLPALAFTISIDHAEQVTRQFRDAGYRAVALSGHTERSERRQVLASFRDGGIDLIASCQILGEGLDVPGVRCILMLRPTLSLTTFLQQCGRASRPAPDKSHYVLLDLVGNTARHGLPHEDREWSLSAPPKRKGNAPVWRCEACDHVNPGGCSECENCGAPHTRPERQAIVDPIVQLVEQTDQDALLRRRMKQLKYVDIHRQPRTRKELETLAELRGYKSGWVYFATREQFSIFGRWPA